MGTYVELRGEPNNLFCLKKHLPSHLKLVNVYIYLCPTMVSFIWKEVGSQDFKSVGLHQPLHHNTPINTQVGSYVLWNGDWPYVFYTNKPIGTVCAQNEFPNFNFALPPKIVNVYIYLCPIMVSFIWKEVGSQDFKIVDLHQPLHHNTPINTQVGSYELWNGDWPYVFCTNKPIGTVCAHNEFPNFNFALPPKIGQRLHLFMSNNGIIYMERSGESGLQKCGLTSTTAPQYPH